MKNHRKLIVAFAVGALAVMALVGHLIWSGYREAIGAAEVSTRGYAAVLEARLDATLRHADAELQQVISALPLTALSQDAVSRHGGLNELLMSKLVNFPELAGVWIFDTNGNTLYASSPNPVRINVADRRHFRQVRDDPRADLVISDVVVARTASRQSFAIARALRDERGAFLGMASVLIDLAHFQKLFQALDVGAGGVVAIYRSDNFAQVLRWPDAQERLNVALPAGSLVRTLLAGGRRTATHEMTAASDGRERIYSWHALQPYPFFIAVGVARNEVLAGWWRRSLLVGSSTLLLLGLLLGLLLRLVRADASLQTNEAAMRNTFEHAAVGIAQYHAVTFRFLMVNDIYCQLLGYTREELIGMDSRALTPAHELPSRDAERARLVSGEIRTSTAERRLGRKDGSTRWFNRSLSLVRDTAGTPAYFVVVLEDIEARKQAEEMLQMMRFSVDHAGDSVFWISREGRILYVNDAACASRGYEREELLGMTIFDINPDYRDDGWARHFERLKNRGSITFESFHRSKEGRGFPIEVNANYVHINGQEFNFSFVRDITERKLAEAALTKATQRLEIALEGSRISVWETDLSTNEIWLDATWAAMLGHPAIETRTTAAELMTQVPAEDRADIARIAVQVMKGEIPRYAIDHRVISATGEWRWIQSTGRVIERDANGRPLRMSGTNTDITERKQTEAEHARLAAIIEHSNDAIYSRSLDGTILSWNAGAEKMLGYSAAEAVGKIAGFTQPRDRPLTWTENNEKVLRGEVFAREADHLTKDGRLISVFSSLSPIRNDTGTIVGVSVIMQDVTALKQAQAAVAQSEARFRATFEQVAVGIAHYDLQNRNTMVNRRYCEITGYTAEELLGRQPGLLTHPDDDGLRSEWQRCRLVSGEIDNFSQEMRYVRKDGQVIWVTRTESLARDAAGKALYCIRVVEDITQRKQAEAARASLEAQLRESQKMQAIGTLAGGIAHDFNNIIATILGHVELARGDAANQPAVAQSLSEIYKAGSRARDLVQQILSFSRRQSTTRKPTSLTPIVNDTVRLLRATLPARIELKLHCDPDVPLVLADASHVQQALINLATNAMQAIPNGPGRISIRLDSVMLDAQMAQTHPSLGALLARHPGRVVRLALSDSGVGMDAVTRERIFEPFFTTKPMGKGTGLGLSVVHGIVEAHDGAITVDSEPGHGAIFTLYLPATAPLAAISPDTTGGTRVAAPTPRAGARVLYIDDDAALTLLLRRLLDRRGYAVSTYTNPREALAALRAAPNDFDLVLSDYNMPLMSGLEVASEVRAIRPNLPVAVISGFIDETLQAQASAAGVRELIFKADSVNVIYEVVDRLTRSVEPESYAPMPPINT